MEVFLKYTLSIVFHFNTVQRLPTIINGPLFSIICNSVGPVKKISTIQFIEKVGYLTIRSMVHGNMHIFSFD